MAFLIVPIFGFANAGVSFAGLGCDARWPAAAAGHRARAVRRQAGRRVRHALRWPSALGWPTCRTGASWPQLYGVSLLCGIGFTMSLFIGLLAFPDNQAIQDDVKIGILAGSLVAAVVGTIILLLAPPPGPGED